MSSGYSENDLVKNRTSMFLYGSTEAERTAWAEEAARSIGEGLRTVKKGEELARALEDGRGVLYVPDLEGLGPEGQALLVRCLREREERPKLVLALGKSPDRALEQGTVRADLHYALKLARVDLGEGEIKEAIRARRARSARGEAAPKRAAVKASKSSGSSKKPQKKSGSTRRK